MVLVGHQRDAELGLVHDVLDCGTTSDIPVSFGYRKFAHLVRQVAATELPEVHVLDASRNEASRGPRDEVNVFDLERERVQEDVDGQHLLGFPVEQ